MGKAALGAIGLVVALHVAFWKMVRENMLIMLIIFGAEVILTGGCRTWRNLQDG